MFYSGPENMMTDFVRASATQLDVSRIEPVFVRAATIMVHPGNPPKIQRFADPLRPGVHIIIVQGSGQMGLCDDVSGRVRDTATIQALRRNIVAFERDTRTTHDVWDGPNAPDAWIAFPSEHGAHSDESDVIASEGRHRHRPRRWPCPDQGRRDTAAGGRSPDRFASFQRFGWMK